MPTQCTMSLHGISPRIVVAEPKLKETSRRREKKTHTRLASDETNLCHFAQRTYPASMKKTSPMLCIGSEENGISQAANAITSHNMTNKTSNNNNKIRKKYKKYNAHSMLCRGGFGARSSDWHANRSSPSHSNGLRWFASRNVTGNACIWWGRGLVPKRQLATSSCPLQLTGHIGPHTSSRVRDFVLLHTADEKERERKRLRKIKNSETTHVDGRLASFRALELHVGPAPNWWPTSWPS